MELDLLQPRPAYSCKHIDDTEYRRRREGNLCLYCAAPDHRVAVCPLNRSPRALQPQRAQVAQGTEYLDAPVKASAQE